MSILQKNLWSILCGVVTLVAIIASFWPLGSKFSDLQSDLDKRKTVHDGLNRLLNAERKLPVNTFETAEAEELTQFPSDAIIAAGQAAVSRVQEESQRMLEAAIGFNRHELLVPGSLPDPGDTEMFRFRDYYNDFFKLKSDRVQTIAMILEAGTPPTDVDLKQAGEEIQKRLSQNIIVVNGKQVNAKQIAGQIASEVEKLPEQLKLKAAQNNKVYLELDNTGRIAGLDYYRGIDPTGGKPPDAKAIWYAQMGLWVQDDVARAIAAANASSTNILDATVKRLEKIDVTDTFVGAKRLATGTGGAMGMGMGMGYGAPVEPAAGGPIPKDYNISPTGRVTGPSNPLFDVLHFNITTVVEADKVPVFLQELGRGRLVTVLRIEELKAVDAGLDQSQGFIYGPKPTVRLSLLCESIFMRAWTRDLMPKVVRQELGLESPTAAVAGQLPGMSR